ncbi:hypothetical protein TRIP_C60017 [Candidatus Zixiibacteriota bacterium]|nr:hypothetical protein TRIP_C60017 [candidate division Zixibacteria bacterium]
MKSRIKRSLEKLRPIQITERDKNILLKVFDYRILSAEQINRLLFSSISRARKRLFQLWQHAYLNRVVMPTRMGDGSSAFFYTLSKIGAKLLINKWHYDLEPNTRSKISLQHSIHTSGINNFRISLELAVKLFDDLQLSFWKQGRGLKMVVDIIGKAGFLKVPIIPDAFFGLNLSGRDFYYFLEIDQGTTDLTRIRQKFKAYLSLWSKKENFVKLGIHSFRVIYITNSERRLKNMLQNLLYLKQQYSRLDIIAMRVINKSNPFDSACIYESNWNSIQNNGEVVAFSPFPFPQNSRSRQVNHQCVNQKPELAKGEHGSGG